MEIQPGPLTIDLRQLKTALVGILDQIEDRHGPLVEVGRDHYWLLELEGAFSEDLHQPGEGRDDFGVGQISDDIESVTEVVRELQEPDGSTTPWHDLEHAVGLLRALAWLDLAKR
jgi:hypothetical protein